MDNIQFGSGEIHVGLGAPAEKARGRATSARVFPISNTDFMSLLTPTDLALSEITLDIRFSIKRYFFVLCGLMFLYFPSLVKANFIEHDTVIVQFDAGLERVAKEILLMYPVLKSKIEQTLGWPLDFRATVVILNDEQVFQRRVGREWAVAYAVSQQKRIVINMVKLRKDAFSLSATLKHEMAHLMLHRHIDDKNLPKWLDEGIAQWISGEVTEIRMGGKGIELQQASLSQQLIPLAQLRERFPKDEKSALLAYAQSKSLIEYIEQTYGLSALKDLLQTLKAGEPIEVALGEHLSISLRDLEKAWQAHLKKGMTWIAFFGNNLMLFLFALGGLLTVYGFVRFIIKKRAYIDDEDEELESTDFFE